MNKYLIILGITMLWAACTPNTEKAEEESTEQAAEQSEENAATEELVVLNPNLASSEELASIPQLNEEMVNTIIDGRPYLKSTNFLAVLNGMLPAEVVSDVCVGLFVPMNLNTTEEADFLNVPGVGDRMAHEFEEYRPYKSVEQFRREIGKYVDEAEVARYENYVFVPVNLNTGTKEEILAIPGVGERMLHEFEEYRPYQNMEQFRREIGKYVDDNELARLERYVTLEE